MIALLDFARVLRNIFGEGTTRVDFFHFTFMSLVRALNEGMMIGFSFCEDSLVCLAC